MKMLLFVIGVLLLLPLAYAQDTCSNKIKDPGEEGVDCGIISCGVPCSNQWVEKLPAPGEEVKTESSSIVPPPPPSPSLGSPAEIQPVKGVSPTGTSEALPETSHPTPVGKVTAYGALGTILVPLVKYSVYLLLLFGVIAGVYYGYMFSRVEKEIQLNPELLNYINLCQARNIPKEQVYQKLLSSGYDKAEVEYHFKQAR